MEKMMKRSKRLISQALSTLKNNLIKTGDPMGFKDDYWSKWARETGLPMGGSTVLFTGRMYQMLPFVIQTTRMVPMVKPLLDIPCAGKLMEIGNQIAGEKLVRFKALGETEIRERAVRVLKGITATLAHAGIHPGYLYEKEPYSGVLLYDLGLEEEVEPHIRKVYRLFNDQGVKRIITMDPHTTFMLREVFPRYIKNYHLDVVHYLELLSESPRPPSPCRSELPRDFVLHDSCVMTRDLDIINQVRSITKALGLSFQEPENTGFNTACCGGPVEYAFGDICHQISRIRIEELMKKGKNIITTCPICLINLKRYEQEMGVRIWDMGEILYFSQTKRGS